MKRQHRQLLSLWIGLLCMADRASALGLGEVQIYSHLGEPLDAEVQVLDQSNEQSEVRAAIGKDSDYQALGIEYSALHAQLSFEPVSHHGQNYLRIRSDSPVHEPYLDFVLSLRGAQGQLLREVTILLDPKPQAVQPATPNSSQNKMPGHSFASVNSSISVTSSKARAEAPKPDSSALVAGARYRVQAGDSLWKIAQQVAPADMTQEQTMQAIMAFNQRAFIGGDPARIMLGYQLTIPNAQQIAQLQTEQVPFPQKQATQQQIAQAGDAQAAPAPKAVAVGGEPEQSSAGQLQDEVTLADQAKLELEEFLQQKAQLAEDMRQLSATLASLNQRLAQATQTMAELKGGLPAPAEVIYPLALAALPDDTQQLLSANSSGLTNNSGLTDSTLDSINTAAGSALNAIAAAAPSDITMPFMMVPPANAATTNASPLRQAWWNMLLAWVAAGGLGYWLVRRNRAKKATKGDGQVPLAWPLAKNWRELRARDPESLNAHSHEIANFNLPLSAEPEAIGDLTQELDSQLNKQAVISQLIAFGRYAEAEGLIMTALKINPDINALQLLLLNIYLQTQRLEQFRKLEYKLAIKNLNSEELTQLSAIKANYVARYEQGETQFNFRRVS